MPTSVSISFRDQTTGRINDLLEDEFRPCAPTQNLMGYLIGALINLREEGVPISPSIVICSSVKDYLQVFPDALSVSIGQAPLDASSGPKILKDCAPLSGPQWFIFIERLNDTTINYGVFNYLKLPSAISLEESIYIDRERFCLLLEKDGANVIKISGSKGNKLRVYFSTFREPSGGGDEVLKFANSCCASLAGEDDFKRYFAGMTNVALTHGHGTILACCRANILEIPEFKDSIKLDPPVDFREAFAGFAEAKSGEALLKLKRAEDLFMGFISCDGIILLDTYGHVVAYRVFFRATKETLPAQEQVVGGARRRAFEGVKQLVGDKLTAALFRSQDGLVLLAGGTE